MNESITRLEEKIAYLERHVVEQDKAMLELSEEIEQLRRELKLFNVRLAAGGSASGGENQLTDERPPHY